MTPFYLSNVKILTRFYFILPVQNLENLAKFSNLFSKFSVDPSKLLERQAQRAIWTLVNVMEVLLDQERVCVLFFPNFSTGPPYPDVEGWGPLLLQKVQLKDQRNQIRSSLGGRQAQPLLSHFFGYYCQAFPFCFTFIVALLFVRGHMHISLLPLTYLVCYLIYTGTQNRFVLYAQNCNETIPSFPI